MSKKISQLTELTTVQTSDVLPVVNGGATKKVTKANLLKEVNDNLALKATQTAVDTALAGKAAVVHIHDDRYYTEGETTGLLAGKSDAGHSHAWGTLTGLLSSQTDLQAALDAKASASHVHDDRYYTETEINTFLAGKEPANSNIQLHIVAADNPHNVTKAQVGLGNADNTSDANKPISTAVQTALNGRQASLGFTPVNKAGDAMSGMLNLPSNGLIVGTSQLVSSGGNIGIGTTSPASILDVRKSATAGRINIDFSNTAAIDVADRLRLRLAPFTGFVGTDLHPYVESYVQDAATGQSGLAFGTYTGSALNERLRIDGFGNVGINSSNPTEGKLVVNGGVTGIHIKGVSSGGDAKGIEFGANSVVEAAGFATAIYFPSNWYGSSDNYWSIYDASNAKVYLNGSIGIGTNGATAKLDINSDILRLRTAKTPATSGASGNQGDICWDGNYIYVCTGTNAWKRAALATW